MRHLALVQFHVREPASQLAIVDCVLQPGSDMSKMGRGT